MFGSVLVKTNNRKVILMPHRITFNENTAQDPSILGAEGHIVFALPLDEQVLNCITTLDQGLRERATQTRSRGLGEITQGVWYAGVGPNDSPLLQTLKARLNARCLRLPEGMPIPSELLEEDCVLVTAH
jgi:hypothetical protein